MMDTDATDAIKEKSQDEINEERAKLVNEAEQAYAKAFEIEAKYANELESGLERILAELPEDRKAYLAPLKNKVLLTTIKYKF